MVRIDLPEDAIRPEVMGEALAGRVPNIPASVALARIAAAELPGMDRQALLRGVAMDQEVDVSARAGAVRTLLRVDPSAALPTALDLAGDANDLLASVATQTLGRAGDPDTLAVIEQTRQEAPGEMTRRAATFAETLIVHRFGLTDREPEVPALDTLPEPAGAGALSFVSSAPGAYRRAEALQRVGADLPWVAQLEVEVCELQCGPRLLEIVVAADLMTAAGRQALLLRPSVPAIVASFSQEHDEFSTSLLALTRPLGPHTVSVLLTQLTGDPVYNGEGTVTEYGVDVTLYAVRAPGSAAVVIRARVSDDGLDVSGLSGRGPEEPARAPQRMDSPDHG
ncbi:hypothetical protein GCM10009841_21730 [Microlunatus panaciterrae]|uniref:HEAT repeat-containing protein n=1 Tax=Microlunatus panaciterrae TaxID=400768 RepID=A0ABS2RQ50_9ACTN|nr:HEAT repeat domain-containing protein [Microlunatus panaciterrae]MBM7800727.1 hypothetical protein [Microlunatus panaciterrae]